VWCHLLLLSPLIGLVLFLILPWTVALPSYLVIVALSLLLYRKIMQSMKLPVTTGVEGLIGSVGKVEPDGSLAVGTEHWKITSPQDDLVPGQRVRIVGFKDMWLEVQAVDEQPQPN
jgi:membrane protein implicated in regulation of membrane protease activity